MYIELEEDVNSNLNVFLGEMVICITMPSLNVTFCDGCRESCLSMVDVTNSSYIHVWFVAHERFLLCGRHNGKGSGCCAKPS